MEWDSVYKNSVPRQVWHTVRYLFEKVLLLLNNRLRIVVIHSSVFRFHFHYCNIGYKEKQAYCNISVCQCFCHFSSFSQLSDFHEVFYERWAIVRCPILGKFSFLWSGYQHVGAVNFRHRRDTTAISYGILNFPLIVDLRKMTQLFLK
jgi:hypothetical protein